MLVSRLIEHQPLAMHVLCNNSKEWMSMKCLLASRCPFLVESSYAYVILILHVVICQVTLFTKIEACMETICYHVLNLDFGIMELWITCVLVCIIE